MPELPEVETIARNLQELAVGGQIQKVQFFRKDLREPIPISTFKGVMEGAVLKRVFRRSKYLLLETSRGFGIFHLGMTGNLLLMDKPKPHFAHTHLVLSLHHQTKNEPFFLHYIDPRRFGRIHAQAGRSWANHPYLVDLGREPLEGEAKQLAEYLWLASRDRRVPIKNFLMDAFVLVGVGNIYACESLFRAGIHPERQSSELNEREFARLARELRKILRAAIKAGGTSFRDYKKADGQPGYFALALNAYGRKNQPCLSCGNPIAMIRQSGRSTFFCRVCQK